MTEGAVRKDSIHLSLVSHTNIGKTTLARTLLSRDIGEVSDRAHVTETAESFELASLPGGEALVLWDTPGFGNSVALAKRLEGRGNPVGWLMSEVWDRVKNQSLWLSQKAMQHVRDVSSVVLYLVNASEPPEAAPYVAAEMRILTWVGKPVIVLLNQMGEPRPAQEEAADISQWQEALKDTPVVRSVLPMDAFARCWVQEFALFDAIGAALPPESRELFAALRATWERGRREAFGASMDALRETLAEIAADRERAAPGDFLDQMKKVGQAIGIGSPGKDGEAEKAQEALAARAEEGFRRLTDRLIAANGLKGKADRRKILERVEGNWNVRSAMEPTAAAVAGAIGTGVMGGLAADLASGGLTLGLGAVIGGIMGAVGGAGAALAWNRQQGVDESEVSWSERALQGFACEAILLYLAVSHFGRGRGNWTAGESPAFWKDAVRRAMKERSPKAGELPDAVPGLVREVLSNLYPGARF